MRTAHCLIASLVVPFVVACSNDTKPPTCAAPGGPAAGAADSHCGATVVRVVPAACTPPDAGTGADAGDTDGGTGGSTFGDTMFNNNGDDDDCKYHINWAATAICENIDVRFDVTISNKFDDTAVQGAHPSAEVFLNAQHPAPNSGQTFTEVGLGTYKIGPIRFDQPGRWTVRFHMFENCHDSETSPHGHGAFFVDVP